MKWTSLSALYVRLHTTTEPRIQTESILYRRFTEHQNVFLLLPNLVWLRKDGFKEKSDHYHWCSRSIYQANWEELEKRKVTLNSKITSVEQNLAKRRFCPLRLSHMTSIFTRRKFITVSYIRDFGLCSLDSSKIERKVNLTEIQV